MPENREPQNIECRMLNIEGKKNFIISASGGFDIQYRENFQGLGLWSLVSGSRRGLLFRNRI